MFKKIKKILLFNIIILIGIFFSINYVFAMPEGTLLYRTSENNKLYGYNTNELFKVHLFEKQKIELNCGHVGIYIGKEDDGIEYVVEAVNNGIQKTPVKYFVNKGTGEKIIGAKIPNNITKKQRDKVILLAKKLAEKNLKYDFDFRTQKGSNSEEWICVGLTEKLYESADVNIKGDDLIYNPSNYAINITPDGYDDSSIYNSETGDCFAKNFEYSKISKRSSMGEIVGTNCGKEYNNERYFFLPYTQFLQPNLKEVEVDIELSSDFSGDKIRGIAPVSKILLSWAKNNTVSSSKIAKNKVKNSWSKVVKSYKNIALFFSSPDDIKQNSKIISQNKEEKIDKKESDKILDKIDDTEIKVLSAIKEVKAEKINKKNLIKPKLPIPVKIVKKNKLSIKYVIDGDTFVLSTGEKVRYIGVDTPELKRPGPKDDECLAWVARIRNMQLLGSGDLKLVKDPSADKDKYGRLLRYVYAGDIFINERLALEGLAEEFFCKPGWKNCPVAVSVEHINKIKKSVKSAKENKRGIYSSVCNVAEIIKPKVENKIIKPKISEVKKPASTFFFGRGGSSPEKVEEENNKILEIKIQDQEISTNTVDVFKLFDLITNSNNYTASATVGVIIEINKIPDAYYIFNSNDIPATTSDQWQINLPEKHILEIGDGLKNINLWLKYGEEAIFGTSTEIILDQKSPIISIIPNQPEFHNASSSSFMLSVDEDVFGFQYKFINDPYWHSIASSSEVIGIFNEGDNSLFAEAIDLAGNFASSSYHWIIDMTAPSSTMDILPAQIATTTFLISWSGEDEVCINSYDVQYRIDDNWIDIASSTTATSSIFNIDIATTTTVYFRVRAIDKAGNIEDWPISEQGDTFTKIIPKQLELTDNLQYLWHFDGCGSNSAIDSIKLMRITDYYNFNIKEYNINEGFGCYGNFYNSDISEHKLKQSIDSKEFSLIFYWNNRNIHNGYADIFLMNSRIDEIFDIKLTKNYILLNHYDKNYLVEHSLPDNDWHHITVVNNENYLALYINGEIIFLEEGDFSVKDLLNRIHFNIGNSFMIAMYILPDFAELEIDELAIWDRALSADEVKILNDMTTQFYPNN